MADSNDRVQIPRVPTEALRSLPQYLPGTAPNAPKRNAIVVLVYAFAFLLLAGLLQIPY
ncbi:hypothetical protein [Halorubrum sp. Hd13]|uniref:hypothetical protein n=1 Tax=Halorubrum sp. Hd13 TaxID=1480728 RepID=UPI00148247AA|nr:hypothetical protein [Halorubrum sp. Hd13]